MTYLIHWDTNYGLACCVVNADSAEEAESLAEQNGAWPGCTAVEIDTKRLGVVVGRVGPTG